MHSTSVGSHKTFRVWYRYKDQTSLDEPYAMLVSAPSVEIACGQVRHKVGEPIKIASAELLTSHGGAQ